MSNSWTVEQEENGDGWQVHYEGQPWPHTPHATKESARDYLTRLQRRYRGNSPSLFMNHEEEQNTRHRSLPYAVVHGAASLFSAVSVVKHLPEAGYTTQLDLQEGDGLREHYRELAA